MAGEPTLTITGNTTAPVELRFTRSSAAVASFTVASTPRVYSKQDNGYVDGETIFMRCNAWRELAENAAESLVDKGMRVVVTGRLVAKSFQDRDGNDRTNWELEADELGPSLRFATAKVARTPRPGAGKGGAYAGPPSSWPDRGNSSPADSWGDAWGGGH